MINFISGKPGGGKSLYAVMQVCWELEHTERHIVTNLALKLPELAEWCHEHIPRAVDLPSRLRILEDSEVREFFLYRPGLERASGRIPVHGAGVRGEAVTVPDLGPFQALPVGCLYVLDEAHLFFGARDWQRIGADVQFFMSQHRKLGCDVLVVTQHPEKTDKNFRRDAQDFTFVRNLGKERLLGGITLPGRFRRSTFLDLPRGDDSPMEVGYFKLRVEEYGSLYDTSAGVGLSGRVDTHESKKGRSPWFLVVYAVLALAGIYGALRLVGWASRAAVATYSGHAGTVVASAVGVEPSKAAVAVVPVAATAPVGAGVGPGGLGGARHRSEFELVSVAWCWRAELCTWVFSDGTRVGVKTPGFGGGGPDYVVFKGVRYDYQFVPSSSPAPVGPSDVGQSGPLPASSEARRRLPYRVGSVPAAAPVDLSSVPVPF